MYVLKILGCTTLLIALFLLIFTPCKAQELTSVCEQAITDSVVVHLKYMDGIATLSDSYNAENKMKRVCDGN